MVKSINFSRSVDNNFASVGVIYNCIKQTVCKKLKYCYFVLDVMSDRVLFITYMTPNCRNISFVVNVVYNCQDMYVLQMFSANNIQPMMDVIIYCLCLCSLQMSLTPTAKEYFVLVSIYLNILKTSIFADVVLENFLILFCGMLADHDMARLRCLRKEQNDFLIY